MITRRNCLVGASAALICAPAIAQPENLMALRGVIMPVQRHYYGFVDRLWIDHRYRHGQLRGRALIQTVEEGLLRHIPPEQLAYDIARWGTYELLDVSSAATRLRQEGT